MINREKEKLVTVIKVCHMTSAHYPEDERIFHRECTSLAKAGYEVYLVERGDTYEKNGVHIVGIGEVTGGRINRMINVAKRVYEKAVAIDADIYHLHDPELLPYGLKLKKLGKKVIFDRHENVADSILEKQWIPFLFRKMVYHAYKNYEKKTCNAFDAVIYVSPNMKERSAELNSIAVMVTNYPIYKDMPSAEMKKNRLVCAGGITEQWNHHNILKAMENVEEITYLLCGSADKAYLDVLKSAKAWERVDFLGKIPHSEVFTVLNESLIGLALAAYSRNSDWKVGTLGNTKIFEEMMMGLPVICTDFDLWCEFVDRYECGICVNPTDVGAITKAIEYLFTHPEEAKKMGENGRHAVREEFNWDTQAKKLIELYEDLEKN